MSADKKIFRIGLTGPLASGKATIARFLGQQGVGVLDGDSVLQNLVFVQPQTIQDLIAAFGDRITDSHGRIARAKLTAFLSESPDAVKTYQKICFPKVREEIKRFLYGSIGNVMRVVHFSYLFPMGIEHLFEEVWILTAEEQQRVERLVKRDSLSHEEARQRIEESPPIVVPETLKNCRIIDNSKPLTQVQQEVQEHLSLVKKKLFQRF